MGQCTDWSYVTVEAVSAQRVLKRERQHAVREPCRGGTPEASDGRLAYKNNLLKEHNRERDRLRKDARQTRDDRRNND